MKPLSPILKTKTGNVYIHFIEFGKRHYRLAVTNFEYIHDHRSKGFFQMRGGSRHVAALCLHLQTCISHTAMKLHVLCLG